MADSEKPEENKEEKHQSTLESVFSELGSFAKKALAIGAVAALPFMYSYFDPSHVTRAQVFAYTTTAGHATANVIRGKSPFEKLVQRAAVTTTLSYPLAETFKGLNQLEAKVAESYGTIPAKAAKIAPWIFAAQPAYVVADTAAMYGVGKEFKKTIWSRIKSVFYWLALPSAINVGFLYTYGLLPQMAVSGALSFAYGFMQAMRGGEGSIKNLVNALNPFSYASAGLTATGKLAKAVIYNPLKALYEISSGYTKKAAESVKPQAPTAEAPAR
ncbi:hypothetical protein J4480_05525 [Candidatus Woesearchaeota archaeon]|nr:hypothetical protein [Candidatus Woesearchaeota archaeon]